MGLVSRGNGSWIVAKALASVALWFASIATAAPSMVIRPVATGFGRSGDQMGTATAILGDTALVGSPHVQSNPPLITGAAQVFRNGASGWQREAVLVSNPLMANEGFGSEVALGTDVAAIGTPDPTSKTYVYLRNGTSWTQSDVLVFGGHPAISGDTLAIRSRTGVRVYTGGAGAWVVEADLAPDSVAQGEVVTGLAIDGDTLAFSSIVGLGSGFGEVYEYFYVRTSGTWVREAKLDFGTFDFDFALVPIVALSNDSALIAFGSSVSVRVRGDGSWPLQQALDNGVGWVDAMPQSVALDGDRAVVGCPGDDVLGVVDQGSAYVFERIGTTWSRVARPYDVNGGRSFQFGFSVGLSGEDLLVGAPGAIVDGVMTGSAVPIVLDGVGWTASPALDEGNAHANDYFGNYVAASGSTVIIGAPYEMFDTPQTSGAAYLYDAVGTNWVERARLVPPSAVYYNFPLAVALDGETAVASSYGDSLDGGIDDIGAVYVYQRDGDAWHLEQRIASGLVYSMFGYSLALDGDLLAVGDPGWPNHEPTGRVRLFTRAGNVWTEQPLLQPQESADGDNFGNALALSGTTLVAGASHANVDIEQFAGAAYVFENVGGAWQQQARLEAPSPLQQSYFGKTVALAADTIVVGDGSTSGSHAVYVYERNAGTWTLQASLSIPSAASSLALSTDASIAIVGVAPENAAGSAYVFRRDGDTWARGPILHGNAYPTHDYFGAAASISGDDAFVGAPIDPPGGAVYVISVGDQIFANGFD